MSQGQQDETLDDLFRRLQRSIGDTPDRASRTFEVCSEAADGLRSALRTSRHDLAADAPEALGGQDSAPDPMEYLLAALAACQEATYRYYAAALDIPLDSVSIRVEGDIDLRGRFAVDPNIRPGFLDIVATVELTSTACETDLRRLKAAVDSHCSMVDSLRNPTPVHLDLDIRAGGSGESATA